MTENHVTFSIISALKQAIDEGNPSSISWDMTQNVPISGIQGSIATLLADDILPWCTLQKTSKVGPWEDESAVQLFNMLFKIIDIWSWIVALIAFHILQPLMSALSGAIQHALQDYRIIIIWMVAHERMKDMKCNECNFSTSWANNLEKHVEKLHCMLSLYISPTEQKP